MTEVTERTRVHFTVDVECSLPSISKGGADRPVGTQQRVYGRIGSRQYGIPLIMDLLEAHGFEGTFFCDACMRHLVGEVEAAQVLRDIADRGHDVQLHLHPIFRLWAGRGGAGALDRSRWSDDIGALPDDIQSDMIRGGKEFLTKHSGQTPTIFRAGNYGASDRTLELLAVSGFVADSSYNVWARSSPGYTQRISTGLPLNVPFRHRGLIEFPVTCFRARGYRFFTPEGASFREMRYALAALRRAGVFDVVVVLHSFSFIRAHDPDYREMSFNRIVFRRMQRFLEFLSDNRDDYEVLSLRARVARAAALPSDRRPAVFASVPSWIVGMRMAGQALQRIL